MWLTNSKRKSTRADNKWLAFDGFRCGIVIKYINFELNKFYSILQNFEKVLFNVV